MNKHIVSPRFLHRVVIVAGSFSAVLGLTVIVGWYTHNVTLVQILPTFVPMQYNTALGFLLSGVGLLAIIFTRKRLVMVCGGLVAALGLLTLSEYIFGINLGIDQLLMEHYIVVETSHPGRMAPNTALSFFLTGAVLLGAVTFQRDKRRPMILGTVGSLIAALGLVPFFGYLGNVETAYGWGNLTRMAINTAAGFVVLGVGFFIFAWREDTAKQNTAPHWVAAPVGLASATVAIAVWQALNAQKILPSTTQLALNGMSLVFGLIMAGLLAFSVYLASTARLRASEVVSVNRELKDEIEVRIQAEEGLRTETMNLRNIFAAMKDGIYIVNQEYDIQYVNPVLIKDFGMYEGRKCYEYLHDRKEVCPWCKNSEVFSGKTVRWEWYSSKNQRTYDLIDTPMKNPDGSYSKLEIFRDITERVRADEANKQHLQQMDSLHKIDQVITGTFDLNISLHVILEQLLTQLKVDAADVLLYQENLQEFTFAKGRGFHTAALQNTNILLTHSYAGKIAHKREDIFIPDLNHGESTLLENSHFAEEGFISYYGIPLIVKGGLIGILEIFHRSVLDLDDKWVEYLHLLANQASIAIDNITMFNDMQRSNMELALAYDATIEGWAKALEMRDMETEGHSRRVVDLTMKLAPKMGISNIDLIHIRRGALLHDIGKMGVPDAILQKPGKLSDEEWEIMCQHPVYAYEWLSSIEYLRHDLDIPYNHHEKWDGTGYPRGLKGENIPLPARIFSIVDVWDALNSDRPYRKAWSIKKALEYIKKQSGDQFDPKVVEAFLELIDSE